MFCLRALPQPLDLINEASLMACGLTLAGDEGEASEVQPAATTITVVLANQPTPKGIIRVPAVSNLSSSLAPPNDEISAPNGLEPTHLAEVAADPARENEAPTPARTVPVAPSIQPRVHVLIILKSRALLF